MLTRARMPDTPQLSLLTNTEARRGTATKRTLRVAGLFAGIGGIELGMQRAGHTTELLCENEPTALAVLGHRFADVKLATDVREVKKLPAVDLITAGFPCQDLSQAGKTTGITGTRSGLVGEVFRLCESRETPWLVLENVPFMLQLSRGRALAVIVDALERLGYKWAYRVVDSRAFGLPQRRERVWFVASLDEDPRHVLFADEAGAPGPEVRDDGTACGFYWTEGIRGLGWAVDAVPTLKGGSTVGIPSPPAIWLPSGEIVLPDLRDAERLQGFREGWTSPAETVGRRSLRWKLVGNAVSVPVAEWIGKRLARLRDFELSEIRWLRDGEPWPRAAWSVGEGRQTSHVSAWPLRKERPSLEQFLRFPTTPLSERATAGFLERTKRARLNFPPGFLEAVGRHLASIRAA